MWTAVQQGVLARHPAQTAEEPLVLGLHGGVEAQRTLGLRGRAGGAHERGADPHQQAGVGGHGEARAAPPAEVRLGRRVQAHPAEHLAVVTARHEHDRARVVVDGVAVGAAEEPLLGNEHLAPKRTVSGELGAGAGPHDNERVEGGRRTPGAGEDDLVDQRGRHDATSAPVPPVPPVPHEPSAEHAPQAAHPAAWSVPSIPWARSAAETWAVTR